MNDPLWALVAAVASGLAGLLVPLVVRSLPEPPPPAEPVEGEPPKPTYVDLAGRRLLGPIAAAATAVAVLVSGLVLGAGWPLVYVALAAPICSALAYVDWHTRLLPSRLVLPATAGLVVLALVEWAVTGDHHDVLRAGIGLLAARSFYWVLWFVRSAGMGFGDVRLAALLGLVLGRAGWPELAVGVYAGFLVFAVPGLGLAVLKRDRRLLKVAYPFGPFMVVGALLGLLLGDPVAGGLTGG